jgi:xylan 1,4-beta-xylosidase
MKRRDFVRQMGGFPLLAGVFRNVPDVNRTLLPSLARPEADSEASRLEKEVGRGVVQFEVNAQEITGKNTGFWKAASPHPFPAATTEAGLALLDRAEKYKSITYLRSHNTFDKAGGNVVLRNSDGSYRYDFAVVNKTFHEYVKRGIKPVVEFDFIPEGWAKSLRTGQNDESAISKGEPMDWKEWEDLLRAFMQNLADTFGKDEVRTWYYEVWNEPDTWPVEHLSVFFRLYDTFAQVVKGVGGDFKVGGPACFNLYFMEYFLQHVVNGTNYVTGGKGSPLDFVSHHIYGLSGAWLQSPPEIVPQVSRFTVELLWIERMLRRFDLKGKVEFLLNEWGLCSNYDRTVDKYPQLVYRNNEFSPLFMVKLVDCLYALADNYGMKTSMMAYWGFCGEAARNVMFAGNRDLTTGGNIPKPIMTGFEMLSMLGENRLKTKNAVMGERFAQGERYGIIPTKDEGRIVFIVYNFNETDDDLGRIDHVKVALSNLPPGTVFKWNEILLDDKHNNSYSLWVANGCPADSSSLSLDFMKKVNGIGITGTGTVVCDEKGIVTMTIPLKRHSMKLFELNSQFLGRIGMPRFRAR